jgi:hypothetical protein
MYCVCLILTVKNSFWLPGSSVAHGLKVLEISGNFHLSFL